MGYKSPASVQDAIKRGLRDSYRESTNELLQMQLDRLEMYRRNALKVLAAKHYAHSNGRMITMADGSPVLDHMPVLHAIDRLVRIDQEVNKLNDLYPASKSRVEVITCDMIEEEIAGLEKELSVNDPAGHPGIG
jgi:hypothetical protein